MGCCSSSETEESDETSSSTAGLLNLNEATVAELMSLPGIGRTKAESIVAFREMHGMFTSIDQLTDVPGLGRKAVAKLNGFIEVSGTGDEPDCVARCKQEGEGIWQTCLASLQGLWRHASTTSGCDEAFFFPDDESGQGLTRLLELLSSAKYTLDVAVYSISHEKLAGALVDAHRRGVQVRVLSDDMQAKQQNSAVKLLKKEGLDLRLDASEKFHMHHKFVVIDSAVLISGSLNWTRAAVERSNENIIVSKRPTLCKCFALEFERMWAAFLSGDVAQAPPAESQGNVSALFFPEPGMTNVGRILSELKNARRSIEIAVFTLTLDLLVDELIRKHDQGLRVRIITDNRQAAVPGADAQRLHEKGLQVRIDRSWYAMHHKFAVIDDQTLINGSFNWTAQATKGNQEDAIIFGNQPMLAAAFTEEFDRLWDSFEPLATAT
mmetsp:Transcript_46182/g.108142  ORF Transcript_46182/g.108142 Transcript_46182/m.108142 type:complete len:437 (+) Transcript_46182:56-1366(+)